MNLDPANPDGARNLLLVKLLGGLVITGIVIGLVVGVLGTTVLRSMGLKEQPPPTPISDSPAPAPTATAASDDEEDSESTDDGDDEGDGTADGPLQPPTVLHARPNPASPGAKITLSGTFRDLRGGTLQVQRREGGTWTDFPVTASVAPNGAYSTYIITSRTGTSPYRLLHEQSGRSTPPVRITIG
ncbi:MAG: hypothetical protein ACRDO7_09555 [Nocardioidaceae bacterium]